MNQRNLLSDGTQLKSSQRTYIIQKYISSGSNSIVYQSYYQDTLMPEHPHIVLIKELYPDEPEGRITRDAEGNLRIAPGAEDFFEYHKNSFLLGNQAHLLLSNDGGGRIAENLDSFEANHTLYTVLTSKKGEVLFNMLKNGQVFPTLTDTILFIQNLLKALLPFHEHGLLHLDISPDNLFLLSEEEAGRFPTEVLLLDFNSVYSMKEGVLSEHQYYLGKPDYMAPEAIPGIPHLCLRLTGFFPSITGNRTREAGSSTTKSTPFSPSRTTISTWSCISRIPTSSTWNISG